MVTRTGSGVESPLQRLTFNCARQFIETVR